MTHRHLADKNKSIKWARNILSEENNYLILDTETTGINNRDVVIQMGIINLKGEILFDTMFSPLKRKKINPGAKAIHNISLKDLTEKPYFYQKRDEIQGILRNKTILLYNSWFDLRLIRQTCRQEGVRQLVMKSDCVMKKYSEFIGKWNELYMDYELQLLPGSNHNAIGDCKATLEVIKKMAATELASLPEKKKRKWFFK